MKKLVLILVFLFITVPVFSALEDFDTYTEVDLNFDFVVNTNQILVQSLQTGNYSSYIYKDFTAIDGFDVDGELYISSMADYTVRTTIFAFAQDIGDQANYGTALSLRVYNGNNSRKLEIMPGGQDSAVLSEDTYYFWSCDRGLTVADKMTCSIYSDDDRTTLISTLTSNAVSDELRYLYVIASYDINDVPKNLNCRLEDYEVVDTFAIVTGRSRRFMMMHED